jgi:ubiquinone biosynthesis protein COQ9
MSYKETLSICDTILLQALPNVAFDGWTWDVMTQAAQAAGYDKAMAKAVFPGGLPDAVAHFSDWTDRQMLAGLKGIDPDSLRVRDRVKTGVMARLDATTPWREAARRAMVYWAVPSRYFRAMRVLWRSADRIWIWAGDTATDYNHYTKRVLLSGVISSTTLAWLNDESGNPDVVEAFLDRRIENVLQLGKIIGRQRKRA